MIGWSRHWSRREFPPGRSCPTRRSRGANAHTDRKEPRWTRRRARSQVPRDAMELEAIIPHGLRNGILVQEYHKRGGFRHAAHLPPEGRIPCVVGVGCQTTAGAIPPEVLKRKRYFGLGDDKAEVWDPEAAREADEHTARCANEGYAAEGFVDSDYVRRPRPFIKPSRRWRLHETASPRRRGGTPSTFDATRAPSDSDAVDTRVAREASRAARHRVASMAHDPIVDAGEDVRAAAAAAAAAASHGPGDSQEVG